jgi:RNA polymerase sigma-70 factor (family 1)
VDYRSASDEILVSRIRIGDEAAFSTLYARYFERLYRYAYKRTTDMQAAQDIVQDVFMALWKNRTHSSIRQAESYLATAVKFLSINFLTRNRLVPLTPDELPDSGTITTPEEAYHNRLLLELVQRETNRLPKKCRLVFEYHRKKGLSVKEIADQLGMTPAAVEKQLERAQTRLRDRLKKFNLLLVLPFI